MDEVFWGSMIGSTLRVAAPLMLCALAGLLSERAGVVDIGLEGKMLAAAFAAAATGVTTGSLTLAMLAAMGVGVALSGLHGVACVSHAGNQVVSGVAINIIAAGLTAVLGAAWFKQGGQTPPIPQELRLGAWWPGLVEATRDIPFVGPVLVKGFLAHSVLVYVALALVPAVWWLLWRSRFGLRLRAVDADGFVVTVELHRPEALNAMNTRMMEELRELAAEAKAAGLAVVVWSYPRGPMLDKARGKVDACTLIEAAYSKPVAQGGFDAVLASYALSMFNPGYEEAMDCAVQDLRPGGLFCLVDFHDTRMGFFRDWMAANHVRMQAHLLPALEKRFKPRIREIRNAYGGIWQYLLFIGEK